LSLSEKFDSASLKSLITAIGLRTRLSKEHDTLERSEDEIERRFQQIISSSQQKEEMQTKIEQDFEDVRVKVQRAVVSELLKTFP